MKNFEFVLTKERFQTNGGLPSVGNLLGITKLGSRINEMTVRGVKLPKISNKDVLFAYIGILCRGNSDFCRISEFAGDEMFCDALGIKAVASEETLRQRLDYIAATPECLDIIEQENARLIKRSNTPVTPMHFGEGVCRIALDIDVTPLDNDGSKREGCTRTYHGCNGFAPKMAYLGQEGYDIASQFESGSTHSQKGMPEFLPRIIRNVGLAIGTGKKLLIRMDSGNDSADNYEVMCGYPDVDFIVKRNTRREDPQHLIDYAIANGTVETPRKGKKIFRATLLNNKEFSGRSVHQSIIVVERTIDKNGQPLLVPVYDYSFYYTTLSERANVIDELYHDHGTSEQFHSEFKSELDLERLPSGKFNTNALVFALGGIAYNILRIIGQHSMKVTDNPLRKPVQRRRLRTVIRDIITCASKQVSHARKSLLAFAERNRWSNTARAVNAHFQSLRINFKSADEAV